VPLEKRVLHGEYGERCLQPASPQDATVEDLDAEARGRRQRAREQQVADPFLVDREFEVPAAAEQRGIEPSLELLLALGLDVGRAGQGRAAAAPGQVEPRGRDAGDIARYQLGELLPVLGLVAG